VVCPFLLGLLHPILVKNTPVSALGRWGVRKTFARNRCPIEILKMKIRTKSYIEKLLLEPKPNSEPLLIVIPSAQLAQNPMLCAVFCPTTKNES
jgi:hypothetical protein